MALGETEEGQGEEGQETHLTRRIMGHTPKNVEAMKKATRLHAPVKVVQPNGNTREYTPHFWGWKLGGFSYKEFDKDGKLVDQRWRLDPKTGGPKKGSGLSKKKGKKQAKKAKKGKKHI